VAGAVLIVLSFLPETGPRTAAVSDQLSAVRKAVKDSGLWLLTADR
jgi:hypothetical protein